jgi:hypothetical protein
MRCDILIYTLKKNYKMKNINDNNRKKTKIKRVSECLDDTTEENLYDAIKVCDEIPPDLDVNFENLKEEINDRIFNLRLDVETDKNNLEFFERNIAIKNQEIDRLIRKLNHLLN